MRADRWVTRFEWPRVSAETRRGGGDSSPGRRRSPEARLLGVLDAAHVGLPFSRPGPLLLSRPRGGPLPAIEEQPVKATPCERRPASLALPSLPARPGGRERAGARNGAVRGERSS